MARVRRYRGPQDKEPRRNTPGLKSRRPPFQKLRAAGFAEGYDEEISQRRRRRKRRGGGIVAFRKRKLGDVERKRYGKQGGLRRAEL